MAKTLIDFLNEVDKDEMIYIGAERGTNWIVIDKPDEIIEQLGRIEKQLYARIRHTYEGAIDKLASNPSAIEKEKKRLKRLEAIKDRDVRGPIAKSKNFIATAERELIASAITYKKYDKIVTEWVKLPNRKVLSVYPHETDIPGTSVIVEGYGYGFLWWYGEGE